MADDLDMPYGDMTDTEFEEFCFELMRELGFVNVDWRRGNGFERDPGRQRTGHCRRAPGRGV
ncbi:hypothetical protein [Streptomyces sp. NPDC007904]|jgi:hypothetical protein|uniref:hypothetical protein n=1 Tax=Streptomyces sp. NPDC007904 TaxID=3364787 RepID=UPI0036EF1002